MKVLVTLSDDSVAPRFDLTAEVLIAVCENGLMAGDPRMIILPAPSADELCALILKEGISLVVCGGIEDGHFQYLAWKKIKVIDRVIGPWKKILKRALSDDLQSGDIVR